jgi:hypothetical protein
MAGWRWSVSGASGRTLSGVLVCRHYRPEVITGLSLLVMFIALNQLLMAR